MEPVSVITGGLIITSFFFGERFAVVTWVISTLFGAAAAINGAGVGSIQPAHLLLGSVSLVVFKDYDHVRRMLGCLRFPNPGFWLFCTWLYAVISAIFIPRLWDGSVLVNTIGTSEYGASFGQLPLGPSTGNITQSLYFTGDVICFLVSFSLASTLSGLATLLAYCCGVIFFALLDILTFRTNTTFLLSFMRNASYAIFVDSETTFTKRIIGSFTEASAFAYATLGVFGFSTQLWINGFRQYITIILSLLSLILLLLSTSSTALVSIPFCFLILIVGSLIHLRQNREDINPFIFLVFTPLLTSCCVMAIMLHEPTYNMIIDFLDSAIIHKGDSASGLDRGTVNAEAWENFRESFGIGLGIGSVRAFSFALAVASNLGVIGGAAYVTFIITALFRQMSEAGLTIQTAVRSAARISCLCLITASCVSGSLVDLGLPFFILAGIAASDKSAIVRKA